MKRSYKVLAMFVAITDLIPLMTGTPQKNGFNLPYPGFPLSATLAQSLRPFPQFGNVTMVAPMWGNSSYHAFNIKAEKRFSHGLNFLANYSYSKFIDDVWPAVQRSMAWDWPATPSCSTHRVWAAPGISSIRRSFRGSTTC